MRMKYWGWGMLLSMIFVLSGCGQSYPLVVQTLDFSWEVDLAVPMQKIPSQVGYLRYQESPAEDSAALDSLLVETVVSELPLWAYVQQSLNRLKLYGYYISEESTKKSEIIINAKPYSTLLKVYKIINAQGVSLYTAQYVIDLERKLLLLSYATDTLKHRKVFIDNLSSIVF